MTEKFIKVEIKEKVDALPGKRVRAVGMCFYKPSKDLVAGQTYKLFRNPQNPKDGLCIEVRDRQRVRASLNRNVSMLLAPLVDDETIKELECLVLEEAKWSRGDTGRPAKAHKIAVSFHVDGSDKLDLIKTAFESYDVSVM